MTCNGGIPTIRDFIYDYAICALGGAPQDIESEFIGASLMTATVVAAPGTIEIAALIIGDSKMTAEIGPV